MDARLYKVKYKGHYHLLRILVREGKKMFRLNHDLEEPIERLHESDEQIELISKVNERAPDQDDVLNPRIAITWHDKDNREFQITVKDAWGLRNVFEEFPFLKVPFQYSPRRK